MKRDNSRIVKKGNKNPCYNENNRRNFRDKKFIIVSKIIDKYVRAAMDGWDYVPTKDVLMDLKEIVENE